MADAPWWQRAVFYQIYPRSLQDSNGDGVGDLEGIRRRLPHLAALGVDVLWLSPVFPSPQRDFGYDVADYRGIDPVFGDLAAFDRLVREAGDAGLRVILDLVVNHSSDQHPWFVASRSSRESPYRDYYLWCEARPGGRPPNNWQSVFGGPAWAADPGTGQSYLHLFLPEQPDLNWRNPAVAAEVHDILRFWLDRGVAGFRLDVYNCYLKDAALTSNPCTYNPLGLAYGYLGQRHVHDQDQPELREVLGGMRAVVDAYGGVLVGETLAADDYAAAGRYSGPVALHLAFHFGLLRSPWRARALAAAIAAQEGVLRPDAWPTAVLSNHDFPRATRRLTRAVGERRTDAQAGLAATLLLTVRGAPFVYYGEEIGLREGRIPRRQLQDPVGKRFWPFHKGRDGCRTPMPWTAEGGFSTGAPWLPMNPDTPTRNVEAQEADPDALLHVWRRLLRLRRAHPALHAGDLTLIPDLGREILGWRRAVEGEQALVILNLGGQRADVPLPPGSWEPAFSSRGPASGAVEERATSLRGDEARVWFQRSSASGAA